MKSFKELNEGDSIYIVKCFKSDNIYEYAIETAIILSIKKDLDWGSDYTLSIGDDIYNTFVSLLEKNNQQSWLISSTEKEELCELYIDKNDAIEYVNNLYINYINDIDKHIERLKIRKIDYTKALERWEKRF